MTRVLLKLTVLGLHWHPVVFVGIHHSIQLRLPPMAAVYDWQKC